ncbi:hypothetical protein C8R46DRAFT_1216806 [Mycena filopes]|nr:hypothetical protein C8R46DRAFT_1216806 [Mycena filopes]
MRDDMAAQHLSSVNVEGVVIKQTGGVRKTWRMAAMAESPEDDTEVVFRMQGVLSLVELVAGNLSRLNNNKAANISQRVKIVGLGSASFELAVQNTKVIQEAFSRFFGGRPISGWNTGDGTGETFLIASNRFLTSNKDYPNCKSVPIGPGVDPLKSLERFKSAGLIHTADNIVNYFRLYKDPKSGEDIYYSSFPGAFRVGDIVEIQGSVTAFQTKQQKIKTHFHMQSLTLLDHKYSREAELARARPSYEPDLPATLVRKSWFTEEEDNDVSHTRKKFKELKVSDAAGGMQEGDYEMPT